MNILVLDDHPVFLQGLVLILKTHFDITQLDIATHASTALTLIEQDPDIDLLILDIELPDMKGYDFLTLLNKNNYIIPCCAISASKEIAEIYQVLMAGALGFLPKEWDTEQLVSGLKKTLHGEAVIPQNYQKPLERYRLLQQQIKLSVRQKEVLLLIKKGLSNDEIAGTLNISTCTVKSHVSILFQLFLAKNRIECVESAKKIGFI